MAQRISSGWTLYFFLIIAALAATIHAWTAGSQYFGNEFRTVEVQRVWEITDDEKTTWMAEIIDQATGLPFEHEFKPRAAADFIKEGSKPKVMPMLLEIGTVDPIDKNKHDQFYFYRWVATGALVVLLFWWLFIQCPELFLFFAIFSD